GTIRKRIEAAQQSGRVGVDAIGGDDVPRKRRVGSGILDGGQAGKVAAARERVHGLGGEGALGRRSEIDKLRPAALVPRFGDEEEGLVLILIIAMGNENRSADGEAENILLERRARIVEEVSRIHLVDAVDLVEVAVKFIAAG